MKLLLKWRYPDEEKTHEHTFYDIDPKSISIEYGKLYFAAIENPAEKNWLLPISHVIKMEMEEE